MSARRTAARAETPPRYTRRRPVLGLAMSSRRGVRVRVPYHVADMRQTACVRHARALYAEHLAAQIQRAEPCREAA